MQAGSMSSRINCGRVKRLLPVIGIFCGLAVIGLSLSTYLRSLSHMGQEAAVYDFDGRRYVIDSLLPDVSYADVRPYDDVEAAKAAIGGLTTVGRLRDVPLPGVLLADTGRGIIPLIAIEMDRTFVKAYEPRVGLVIFRRRALEAEYIGLAGPIEFTMP